MAKTSLPEKVKKRDGSLVEFDAAKIGLAVERAAFHILKDKSKSESISAKITGKILERLSSEYRKKTPHLEAIQDMIERFLMEAGYYHIAKAYILYREEKGEVRMTKAALDLKDDLKLAINSMEVLRRRYLLKDDKRNIIETPGELFRRVASNVAQAEKNFDSNGTAEEAEEKFYYMMRNLEFMPNSPTLMNAGTSLGQLSACFVLPMGDSVDSIFDTLKAMAGIHQSGGGTGFDFSHLRPRRDLVSTTKGESSGPVSFMDIFDKATQVIVQGGRRRGANMGILRCDHPDIVEFIQAKMEKERLSNFNISVGVTDGFMEAVKKNADFSLVNPRTGKTTATIRARAIFDLIIHSAWRTGDPGLIFLDEINRKNTIPEIGRLEATNPCGELPLLPYESCNLASINLSRMVKGKTLDKKKLAETIKSGIRFLDDVIEINKFPLPQVRDITLANRKIGLGVMGFADMLIRMGIPYNSPKAVDIARKLMKFVRQESVRASSRLAEERGVFPNYKKSIYFSKNIKMRNATVNTIAPTGTISIIAGCSSGIEPLFGVGFIRNVFSGARLFEMHPLFEQAAKDRGFHNKEIFAQVMRQGSLKKIRSIPRDVKAVFTTAFDVPPAQHLNIQAAFQKYTDNSVSKTINLPRDATFEDIRKIYLNAYQLRCKGITIYRYASKPNQVLSYEFNKIVPQETEKEPMTAESEYSGGCISGNCHF